MRCIAVIFLAIAVTGSVAAQSVSSSNVGAGASALSESPNVPADKLGPQDLVGITVYDSPELTRSVRVDEDGTIRLPMVRKHIQAAGLTADELENAITAALVDEQILVSPVVSVSVIEYHSRPITILGAVRTPTTFQVIGNVTLFDAISRAGGLADNAGTEVFVSHAPSSVSGTSVSLTERIPVSSLLDANSPEANMRLEPGDSIRVPEAGQIYIVGNVKRPGPFTITNNSEMTILKAMSIAGGLDSFATRTAYIYRVDEINGHKEEIPINLKKILARKSPDVPLYANDMVYVGNEPGMRVSAKVLEIAVGVGLAVTGLVIYVTH